MAMVILVALMLLGLPFLFSQSTGPAGARSAAHRQLADAARAYAEAAAVDLAGQGFSWSVEPQPATPPAAGPTPGWFRLNDRLGQIAGGLTIYPSSATTDLPSPIIAASILYNPSAPDRLHTATVLLPNLKDPTDRTVDAVDRTIATAQITDLSGRLDPNYMSVAVWDALLKKVGIADWDDGDGDVVAWDIDKAKWRCVSSTKAIYNGVSGRMEIAPGVTTDDTTTLDTDQFSRPVNNATGDVSWIRDDDDEDRYGQLARALASFRLPGGGASDASGNLRTDWRITDLDQLLAADPGGHGEMAATWSQPWWTRTDPDPGLGGTAPTTLPDLTTWLNSAEFDAGYRAFKGLAPALTGPGFGFRGPLTRAELDRLRPYLTLHQPAQGRGGYTDLGTVVAQWPDNAGNYYRFLDVDLTPLVGVGSNLLGPVSDPSNPHTDRIQFSGILPRLALPLQWLSFRSDQAVPSGTPMLLRLPPSLNWNSADDVTRFAAVSSIAGAAREHGNRSIVTPPADLGSGPLTSLDQLRQIRITEDPDPLSTGTPRTWSLFAFLDPLATVMNSKNAWSNPELPLPRVETPPIDIVGTSVFRIDSTGIIYDRSANVPTAQAGASRIWQAVQQENTLIERRWDTQAKMHQLIVQRHGSRLAAGPNGYRRVEQDQASDASWPDDDRAKAADRATAPWISPRTLPTLATGVKNRFTIDNSAPRNASHLSIDWFLDLGAETPFSAQTGVVSDPTASHRANNPALPPSGHAWGPGDLSAEGLVLGPGLELRYALNNVFHPLNSGSPPTNGALLPGRHLGFWIRPQPGWQDKQVVLFEAATSDPALLGTDTLSRTVPTTQNLVRLVYRGDLPTDKRELQLHLVPPAIPALAASSYSSGDSLTTGPDGIDERSGPGAAPNIQPWPDPSAEVPVPWGSTVRYLLPRDGLSPDRWYQIQLVWNGMSPDQMAIIVDGVVGRDVLMAQKPMEQVGDHLALTGFPLAESIDRLDPPNTHLLQPGPPATPPYWDDLANHASWFEGLRQPAQIRVVPPNGIGLAQVFPRRGVLRIDDEYFSYEDITSDTFLRCRRAVRQKTLRNTESVDGPIDLRFPVTQAHAQGALVRPGGVSVPASLMSTLSLFGAGCALKGALPVGENGDLTLTLDESNRSILPDPETDAAELTLNDATKDRVPEGVGGIIRIDYSVLRGSETVSVSAFGRYLTRIGNKLKQIRWIQTNAQTNYQDPTTITPQWTAVPPFTPIPALATLDLPGTLVQIDANTKLKLFDAIPISNGMTVAVVGWEINGDPTTGYPDLADYMIDNDHLLVQVTDLTSDPTRGAVEWVQYQQFLTEVDNSGTPLRRFIFHRRGFTQATRQQQRTPPRDFAAGAMLLPVQSTVGGSAATSNDGWNAIRHLFRSGDVLTLVPKGDTGKPLQFGVRYAVEYAAPLDPSESANLLPGLFAFDASFTPGKIDLAGYALYLGAGGSNGRDLSPVSSNMDFHDALPRVDRFKAAGAVPQCTYLPLGQTIHPDAVVDGLVAGPSHGGSVALSQPAMITHVLTAPTASQGNDLTGDPSFISSDFDPASGDVRVVVSNRDGTFNQSMGLVAIGGEVFAYRRGTSNDLPFPPLAGFNYLVGGNAPLNNRIGVLIGRSLLGSHRPTVATTTPLSVLPIPIGPVAVVADRNIDPLNPTPADPRWFRLVGGGVDSPRTIYVINPDPDSNPDTSPPSTPDLNLPNAFIEQSFAAPLAQWDAPASLVCGRMGDKPRVIQFVGPRNFIHNVPRKLPPPNPPYWDLNGVANFSEFTIADWMLGLYNSGIDIPAATAGPQPGDLVIGWWPRYPSALPAESECRAEHFRCRTYAWAGFPLRYSDSVFWWDPSSLPAPFTGTPVAEVRFPDNSDGFFTLAYRAMSSGVDWTTARNDLGGTTPIPGAAGPAAAFDNVRFRTDTSKLPRPVDGAELRVTWHYQDPRTSVLSDIAANGNRAPRIGPVILRCRAPTKILDTETSR